MVLVKVTRPERVVAVGGHVEAADGCRGPGQHGSARQRQPRGGRVHHVRHDAGDVVGSAAGVREVDQLAGRGLGIGHRLERVAQGLVAHHSGQAVRAEQVAVAGHGVVHGQVGFGRRPAVQGPEQQRALGVRGDVGDADPALVHQRLDQRVVVGDLVELALPEQVAPRIPDVAHGRVTVRPQQRGQRGPHALDGRIGDDLLLQPGIGGRHRRGQGGQHVAGRLPGVEFRHGGDGQGAGHLAGRVAAHPVGHREQARPRVRRVLVAFPEEPDVGAYRVAEYKCHLRSSRTVFPMRIGTPSGTGVGRVTFCRSR